MKKARRHEGTEARRACRTPGLPLVFACVLLLLICPTVFGADAILGDSSIPRLPIKADGVFLGGSPLIVAENQRAWAYVDGSWRAFPVDLPTNSGASATANDDLLCIGGIESGKCSSRVERLSWHDGTLHEDRLPDLPAPRARAGAGVLGGTVFVVGGAASPDGSGCNDFYALEVSAAQPQWQILPSLPANGRLCPAVVGQFYMLLVFGGGSRTDCWSYRPKPLDGTTITGWVRLADLPRPIPGGCAIASGQAHVLLVDPGSRNVLAYDAITDSWTALGGTSIVSTVAAASWHGRTILFDDDGKSHQLTIHSDVRRLRKIDYLVIGSYIGLVTLIGVIISRWQKTTEEFALGGRKTPWWVAALSLYATATSSISLMAIPAWNFAYNLVLLLTPFLRVVVLVPQAYIVIPLIRRLNLTSTYEYLERRFNPALRLLASAQCIIFYTIGRASVVILLPSIAISATTGLNVYVSVLAVGVLTTVYTSLGGIAAVMYTDVLQAVVMLLVPILTLIAVIASTAGGIGQLISVGVQYRKFNMAIWSWDFAEPVVAISVLTVLLEVTGFAGDQGMVQRVLSTPNDAVARRATLGNFVICLGGAIVGQLMGVALFGYFHFHPSQLDPAMRNDQVVPLFAVQQLPAGVAGLIIAGLFAGSMSVLSGTVNSVATLVVQDFYLRWRPAASDRSRLLLMRAVSYVAGLIATVIAAFMAGMQVRSLMETWTTLSSLCGAGFVGVYTLGMFSRRVTGTGAMIGACASVVITFAIRQCTDLHWTLYTPLACVSCMAIGYAASLLTPAPQRDLSGLTVYTPRAAVVTELPLAAVP
ncbi:MAG TPA: sodium/solute symporter [Tepidisphaeraceae bacterium]|nr:sodium/solute symporter [Tepidisphaeraceae bacterium]